ncbi:MAG: DUF4339 domain-containing protein [Planctomycetaceae bacterium]|nr:DUF4339 domain-containing protein [Planctomycetaceae bacterium]
MANFFYTDAGGRKRGPYDKQQLQALVLQGIITPNTLLETDTGHKGIAEQIPGLFPSSVISTKPMAGMVPLVCGIICLVLMLVTIWFELLLRYMIQIEGGSSIVGSSADKLLMFYRSLLFFGYRLFEIVFVAGMFFGCRGLETNRTQIAKIGLLLCIIAFFIPRLYWTFNFIFKH